MVFLSHFQSWFDWTSRRMRSACESICVYVRLYYYCYYYYLYWNMPDCNLYAKQNSTAPWGRSWSGKKTKSFPLFAPTWQSGREKIWEWINRSFVVHATNNLQVDFMNNLLAQKWNRTYTSFVYGRNTAKMPRLNQVVFLGIHKRNLSLLKAQPARQPEKAWGPNTIVMRRLTSLCGWHETSWMTVHPTAIDSFERGTVC